jgi:cell wall-associated NlpC family hydrolase
MKMKNFLCLLLISFFISSCSTLKPASPEAIAPQPKQKQSSIEFINNVSITPGGNQSATPTENKKDNNYYIQPANHKRLSRSSAIENFSSVQFKYAILEDAEVEEMRNEKLLDFMEEWYGAKYHFGGNGKDGIDCSAFVSTLMSSVYGLNNLPRMSKDQYHATPRIAKKYLQEGDLVFFHTYGKRKIVTHVGVYLHNNKFVHASISGVMISDMSDGYYADHYVGAGRALESGMKDAAAN